MLRLRSPASRLASFVLCLLLLAQLGMTGLARAAQPQWIELCSVAGTRYVPAATDDLGADAGGHDSNTHCPACPIWQPAALPVPPAAAPVPARIALLLAPLSGQLPRSASYWHACQARGPPLPV